MSNNKQSSVGILEDFLLQRCVPIMDGVKWHEFKLVIEQAKAMHKEEMLTAMDIAFRNGLYIADESWGESHESPYDDSEDYYNKTFGGTK